MHELLNVAERRRRDLSRECVAALKDGSKVAGFLRQLVAPAADRPEALVDRVEDEALERGRPRVADLVRDLLGRSPETQRGDLEQVGDRGAAVGS